MGKIPDSVKIKGLFKLSWTIQKEALGKGSEIFTLLDKEPCHLYSGNPDWRDVRAVEGGGLENR